MVSHALELGEIRGPIVIRRRIRYDHATFAVIFLGIAFHLAYSTHLELVGDEAYYWLWSRHPDICYLDKGPMIAWLIGAGTFVFGQTVFGVRFFAVLLAAGTGIGLYLLGRDLFSARVAFWAVVLATLTPLLAVGTSLMTIDTVYVFFWTWAAWTFWRAKGDQRLRWWILTGLIVGLGILSKYTAVVELLCFAIFCCVREESRICLRRPTFWIMMGVALVFFLPAILWNSQHGWPTSHWLLQRGGLNNRFSLHPGYLLEFLGAQAGVVSPLIFLGLLAVLSRPALLRAPQPATTYTLALTLPLLLFYLVVSLHYREPPNWTAAAYIGGFLLLSAKWLELAAARPWARWAAAAALALSLIETGILLDTRWLHLPPKLDPLDRARGSQSLATSVAQVQHQTGAQFIIADNYMTAALLSFYLPGQPETFVPITSHPLNQLEVWPTYEEKHPTGAALFVSKRKKVSLSFRSHFAAIEPLGKIDAVDEGRVIQRYKLYVCWRRSQMPIARAAP